jgi:DNA-3-methyladenine glycosylase II
MRIIETDEDIAEGLRSLGRRDPRLRPIIKASGKIPLRRGPPGFEGLAEIVVNQQLSAASAAAIWGRFAKAFPDFDPARVARARDAKMQSFGLSGAKIRTIRAIAAEVKAGLDIDGLASVPGEEAHARLTQIKGVGPWTADIYLLFSLGHADVFPAGDLALRNSVMEGLALRKTPSIPELAEIATMWSPWRGVAARLFWAYYRVLRNRDATPAL